MTRDFLHCCFCDSTDLRLRYQQQQHPVFPEMGQFTIYSCNNCLSMVTYPVPQKEALEMLYGSFKGGIQEKLQQFRSESPLDALYTQSIRRAIKGISNQLNENSAFTWLDVGAGDGILSAIMAEKYPNAKGIAVDFHSRPERLNSFNSVNWIQADLNIEKLSAFIQLQSVDLVISLAVLEHVQDPQHFIQHLLPLICKNGMMYIACPASDSLAGRIMGRSWPYFIPGEHINIPSKKGCRVMLKKLTTNESNAKFKISVKSIFAPYPMRYLFNYVGRTGIAKHISPKFTLPMPSGVLEATVTCL